MTFSKTDFDEPNIVPASSICVSIFDGTHDSPKQQDYGFKLVTSRHIKANKVLLEEAYFINEEDYLKINKRSCLQIGDVLFTMIGTVGEVCRLYAEPDFAIKNIGVFRPKEPSDSFWIYYYLLSPEGRKNIEASKRGTTQQFMGLKELREFPINFPKDSIYRRNQMRILELLDAKIDANNALSKTLEDIAQTIFKSWFIDFDPVKAKMAGEKPAGMDAATAALFPDSMEESELGIVPSGWKVTKLSSSLKLHKSTVKAGASTESVPYVPVDQIGAKDIFLKNSMPGSAAKTSLVSFRKNDILFGAMRPYFHKVVLAPFDGTTRTTTFVLRVINSNYLSHSLFTVNQENAVAFATNNSQGTTIPYAVWNNSFEDFPMVLPPEPTAKAFNDLVLPIIEYGYSLIAQNRSLVEIRNGLLPRLISGELQIPDEMLAS